LDRPAIEETLGISKSTLFVLLREYRHNQDEFSLAYYRETPTRISGRVEKEIEKELMLQKNLLDDSTLPITTYNYSAIRGWLSKLGIVVALFTIIDRAKI
jgi:transposase